MSYGRPPQHPHQPQQGASPQPQAYHSTFAQPHMGQPAQIARPAPAMQHLHLPPVPARVSPLWFIGWIGVGLLALWVVFSFVLPMLQLAAIPFFVASIIALVPFIIVILTVLWIDNWEPEPKRLIIFALAWGGIASIGLTTLVLLFTDWIALDVMGIAPLTHEVISTILRAPLVEELFKMLGVLVIVWMAKNTVDGPIDGLVYGALIGAGFAFTENIQYFLLYGTQYGVVETASIFFMRGVLSPFAHAMFTGIFGLLIGLALRNRRSLPLFALMGYVFGVGMHALWNASSFVDVDFLVLYAVLQVPQFVLFIVAIIVLRKEKATITHERLSDYVWAGWFTPQEVDMLATPKGRRVGKQWARTLRGDRSGLMRSFIRDATQLAMARERGLSGRDPGAAQTEQALLHRVMLTRQALLSP